MLSYANNKKPKDNPDELLREAEKVFRIISRGENKLDKKLQSDAFCAAIPNLKNEAEKYMFTQRYAEAEYVCSLLLDKTDDPKLRADAQVNLREDQNKSSQLTLGS